jgi:xylulose-5-phosphate/fructose-6-phosphate phosphoketolase
VPARPLTPSSSLGGGLACGRQRIRFVNVVDLFRLQPEGERPHGLSDRDVDSLFTVDKPIIFNFHGYPWLIHRLAYRRINHRNLHVRGY